MKEVINIKTPEGEEIVHIPNGGGTDYATICGLALDGDCDSGRRLPSPPKAKINCRNCKGIADAVRGFTQSHFSKELK